MGKGLYRTTEPDLGECARVDWSAGDGAPYLSREIYEALNCQPSFDELPTLEAYEKHHRGRLWRYGSPMQRWEATNGHGKSDRQHPVTSG